MNCPSACSRPCAGDDWPSSLRANLQRLQWAASQVRGKLSRENWQALVELQREALELESETPDFGELLDFLNRLVMSLRRRCPGLPWTT